MQLDTLSYNELLNPENNFKEIESALLTKDIIGIKDIPQFESITRTYVEAARKFSALPENIKQSYIPNRDARQTEGYELGAEWFQNQNGEWCVDDKKASYYAMVPDHPKNVWPKEVDLRTPYLALAELIFSVGKELLNALGINATIGLPPEDLKGYGRMLHYHKENPAISTNPNWCGAHFDHGVFAGLVPAYYFCNGEEVDEPEEAGLFIAPSGSNKFEKISATDKSILLFQVGEFGQLLSNDKIKATKHVVKKANSEIERYTFALFYSAANELEIKSESILMKDARYQERQSADGKIKFIGWEEASHDRYRVRM